MTNASVSTRLYAFSGFLIFCMVIISGLGYWGIKSLQATLHVVAEVELPAVRNMSLADMMHDGLRGSVAILLSDSTDQKEIQANKDEYAEMSQNIRTYLDNISKLGVRAETLTAIEAARPEVEAYVQSGDEVMKLAYAGDVAGAKAKLPKYTERFEALEVKLEALGELIEKDAVRSKDSGDSLVTINVVTTLVLILLSIMICLFIVRALIRLLTGALNSLVEQHERINSASTEVSQISSSLLDSSASQSAALQQTASAIEQIDAMVKASADSSSQTTDMAARSENVAQKGKQSAQSMSLAIEEINLSNLRIKEQIDKSNHQILEMAKKIEEIGEKTKVINEIVFQTKLLSFNASVEAARAGEHGKGFAVVAEEVGNLAQMSGNAAHEISAMLASSTEWVNRIATEITTSVGALVEEPRTKLDKGTRIAEDCNEVLTSVVKNTGEMSQMSGSISVACQEQSTGVSEINASIARLVDINAENAKISNEAQSSAKNLTTSAESLTQVINQMTRLIG